MVRKAYWLLLCAFGLVCSCHKEEDVPDAVAEAIAPHFVGQKGVSWKSDTRAADQTWEPNDKIGIYMLSQGNNDLSSVSYKNKPYTLQNTENTTQGTFVPVADTIYFPTGKSVRFVAYYPYQAGADAANTLTFNFDNQSSGFKTLDFAFHKGEEKTYSDPNVTLAFQHKFCKIKITFKKGIGGPSLDGLEEVSLHGVPISATVDLAKLAEAEDEDEDDAITTTGGGITFCVVSQSENQAVAEAIVPPHNDGNERRFHFSVGDKNYIHSLPDDVAFVSGKEYNYEFMLYNSNVSDGLTNCYIVKPGNSKTFPVSRAYVDGTEKLRVDPPNEAYGDEFGASVLWDDPTDLIDEVKVTGRGKDARVTVKTNNGSSMGGNAVVKIFKKDDSNETPVWSYHIWVTNPDKIGTQVNTFNERWFIFMDRNLGATELKGLLSYGLFYQWGRKDPFPGKEDTAGYAALGSFDGIASHPRMVTSINVSDAIIESIQRPTTFFSSKENEDWLPALKNDLWNENDKKTIYDPCPAGWRVPAYAPNVDYSPWNGISWNTIRDQYPRSGYRTKDRGVFEENFGSYENIGLYWSASKSEFSGHEYQISSLGLNIYITNNFTMATMDRANGQSVRCVQE